MRTFRLLAAVLGILAATTAARAHFVWVALEAKPGGSPKAHVYFGESAAPDSAEYLDRLTKLKVWRRIDQGVYAPIKVKKVETDDGGSLTSDLPTGTACVEADCLFGVFSRGDSSMLLHYYAKSLRADAAARLGKSKRLEFDIAPKFADGQLQLTVLWNGKPVEGSQVVVSPPKGESSEHQTNAQGVVSLKATTSGRYEIRARRIEEKGGKFEKQSYDESRYYCTLTLEVGGTAAGKVSAADKSPASSGARFTDLPQGITSFGAAVIDDWVYVYGGHFGRAHHYSNTSQSDELSRLNLSKPGNWEVIAKGPRLQGLAMVAHGGKLYRIGGFTAHNDEDDEHDLRSVADVARFDPQAKRWESLTPLPEPRSSHDAVVIGDKLYVAGGWRLGQERKWHETALVADLSQETIQWKQIPTPPFQRRALSLGHAGGKLYVIGGMQQKGGPTTRVDVFDPSTGKWSLGPNLIDPLKDAERGKGMEGFGSSAYTVDGRLFVSTYGGNLQVFDPGANAWRIAKEFEDDRFFHRMLPFENGLFLVGGASMTSGKRLHFETVDLSTLK